MPFNHYLFHGSFKELYFVASISLSLKLISVVGMVIIMAIIFFKINPELKKMFNGFSNGNQPDSESEAAFFKLRARRKYLCGICLIFAILVLVFSAFIGFAI